MVEGEDSGLGTRVVEGVMITVGEMRPAFVVRLPSAEMRRKLGICELLAVVSTETTIDAHCYISGERRGVVNSIRLESNDLSVDLCVSKTYRDLGSPYAIHAPNAVVLNGRLDLGRATWKSHPGLLEATGEGYSRQVRQSWRGLPQLREEITDEVGQVLQPGFRLPQLGALYAIAAHWSVKASHAKVVLPTGTGKTDVMIASAIMKGAKRVLVIVPTDALRAQMLDRFAVLGALRRVNVLTDVALNPIVARLLKSPGGPETVEPLRAANVVVTTTQMLLSTGDADLRDLLSMFDLVMFDEAHHLPSSSWTRISRLIADDSRVLSLTATPYRNDGRRVPGEQIYQFPLKKAQELGYFSRIKIARVDESALDRADREIARTAVETLRSDEQEGFRHLVMARARTKDHAEALFNLYNQQYPDLLPVLLHSGVSKEDRVAALTGIRGLTNRIVVCVDMLGEGIDIPALKIAALHDSHRSLPVTLQFIGRFTRTAEAAGAATVVLNIAEPMVDTAVEELFAEDADWNDIVPDLSARATGRAEATAHFLSGMQPLTNPEDKKFDLGLISARTSAQIYNVRLFSPGRAEGALGRASRLHQSWLNDDRDLMILITHDLKYPDWSNSKDAVSFDWNLTVLAFEQEKGLLFVNSTYGDSRIARIARAVGGESATLINGEKMFRVFDGLQRAVLYNVGLYRKGQVRFQMLAGMDIGEHVNTAVQAGSTKSNLFAIGFEDGVRANIGASFKGRLWSMNSLSIPEWRVWCQRLASKVLDNSIASNNFLHFTLIPKEVDSRPQIEPFACVPPDELLSGMPQGGHSIACNGMPQLTEVDLSFEEVKVADGAINVDVSLAAQSGWRFELTWTPRFDVRQVLGERIYISDGAEPIGLDAYLTEHPPAVLLRDGSELVGKHHFSYPNNLPYTFGADSILTLNWDGVPLTKESKWRNGIQRPSSIQGFMISECLAQENSFVFDDDDTGEVADIIVLTEKQDTYELDIVLYHCKYASGNTPGARYSDLYEVCGQAVKSARMMNRPEALIAHMIRREQRLGGRPSRFEKGTMSELRSLLRRLPHYRPRLNICVVQPGLSAGALTADLSAILAAADGFVLEFTGRKLRVFGSR